jgi:hypothetical protein
MFIAPDDFPLPARLRESEDYWKRQQSFRARMRASTCPGLQRVLVTVFLAICGGLYKLGYDNGSKDLDTYKDSETFRLPELLSQLGAVSNQFRTFACLSAAGRTSGLTIEDLRDASDPVVPQGALGQSICVMRVPV